MHRVPVRWRRRRFAEPRKIQEVDAMRVLEQRGDAAKAFAAPAPAMKEQEMPVRRISDHLIDQAGSVVLEALDAGDCTSQGEGRSVSRRLWRSGAPLAKPPCVPDYILQLTRAGQM